MENPKEHVIEIGFKIPLDGVDKKQVMSDGIDLDTGKTLNVTEPDPKPYLIRGTYPSVKGNWCIL